jgi:hypothetical protein
VVRPRNRWEDVRQRDTANLLRIRKWKTAARDEEWGKKVWGDRGLKTGRSVIGEEEEEDWPQRNVL